MNAPTLPEGYRQIEELDFVKSRRDWVIVNASAVAIMIALALFGLAIAPIGPAWRFLEAHLWTWFLLAAMCVGYIYLHELTHGVCMKRLSGVKPSYGFKFGYAYAGSDVYFDRNSHRLIALAPVALWGAVLAVVCAAVPKECFWMFYIVQIANVSGAAGDIYCAIHLSRLPEDILIQDTGTRMRVFAPAARGEE